MRLVLGAGQRRGSPLMPNAAVHRRRQDGHDPRGPSGVVRSAEKARFPAGAAFGAAGAHRRASAAMRILLQRDDRQGGGAAGEDAATDRPADSHGDERSSVPLRDVSAGGQSDPARGHGNGGEGMSTRREFIKSGGALIVGFSLGDALHAQAPGAAPAARSLDLKQLDTWLAIHADNTATVYI